MVDIVCEVSNQSSARIACLLDFQTPTIPGDQGGESALFRGDRGNKVSQRLLKREEVAEWDQSSQVDLLAKSEIFDSGGHSARGVWEHGPPGNFEKWK